MTKKKTSTTGMHYSPQVVGKHLFRVREAHVAAHTAELVRCKAIGAAKLDLVLRGIALLPGDEGRRHVGQVLPRVSYQDLHDLCCPPAKFLTTTPEDEADDPRVRAAKAKWVGEQLKRLEDLNLVRRVPRKGQRPLLVVLKDDGSGGPFDDPDGKAGNSYLTVSGSVVASEWFKLWRGPEVAAYLCSMIAERYARHRLPQSDQDDLIEWYQPLSWFAGNNPRGRPAGHVLVPFSVPTLERGFKALRDGGLIEARSTMRNPRGGRFKHPRNIYTNRYDRLDSGTATAPLDTLLIST